MAYIVEPKFDQQNNVLELKYILTIPTKIGFIFFRNFPHKT